MTEKHSYKYGDGNITYELQRKNIKNINLKIRPDQTVVVSAPKGVPHDVIEQYVKNKSYWITKNLNYFKDTRHTDAEREYVSGETFYYMGRQHRLKVIESENDNITLSDGFIYLYTKKQDYNHKKKLFEQWWRRQAAEVFNDSLDRMYPPMQKYNIEKPSIVIRKMKSRWGSCSAAKHQITLNLHLLKAPRACIDYVMLHELLHFKTKNHNRQYYDFFTAMMPDWRERKKILDNGVVQEIDNI